MAIGKQEDHQNEKGNDKIHQRACYCGERQRQARKVRLNDHANISHQTHGAIINNLGKELPHHKTREKEKWVRNAVRRDMNQKTKEYIEY